MVYYLVRYKHHTNTLCTFRQQIYSQVVTQMDFLMVPQQIKKMHSQKNMEEEEKILAT